MNLKYLRLKNIGIIDSVDVDFSPGINILTGETGAGKSLIINAFNMVLGERVNAGIVIRAAQDEALIEAVFSLSGDDRVLHFLEQSGIIMEEDEVLIKRMISRTGKNKCWVNSHLVSLAVLKDLGRLIADICGSHSHQELLDADNHMSLLDRYCRNEGVLRQWEQALKGYFSVFHQIGELNEEERLKNEKLMVYRMQKDELAFLRDMKETEEEIFQRHNLLANAQSIHSRTREIISLISGRDSDLLSGLKEIGKNLEILSEYKENLRVFGQEVVSSSETLLELQSEIMSFSEDIDFSEKELECLEEVLSKIRRLKNKYQLEFEGLRSLALELDAKIERLDNMEMAREDLQKLLEQTKKSALQKIRLLSARRKKGAEKLEKLIERELKDLSIKSIRFQVRFQDTEQGGLPREMVEFYIQTNIGEDMKPLKDITSSGEVSRIMLALKKIFTEVDKIPILIFDEIDANIGGETALIVGRKLKDISRDHQLIVITHMPQIATFAARHFSVRKKEVKGRVKVFVKELSKEERIKELTRMMGGESITSVVARHAEELIK